MDQRYLKRMTAYWGRQKIKSTRSIEGLDYSSWFDFWHTHPDWKSKGNRCPQDRASVALITYELLLYAEKRAESRKAPIQIFATICEDTGRNAIYLHSENPNGRPFPEPFPNVIWGATQPSELAGIVDLETHEIGRSEYSGEIDYIIRRRAIPVTSSCLESQRLSNP